MANNEGTVNVDVRQHMHTGLHVYDEGGEKVGTVNDHDLLWEYMIVGTRSFHEKNCTSPSI
jgi:sporulation protein YlmC with PRC-barrel domain